MVNMVIVNNERCVVGTTNTVLRWKATHTASVDAHKQQRCVSCYVRARGAARALHDTHQPTKQNRKAGGEKKENRAESSVKTVEALVSLTLRRATT